MTNDDIEVQEYDGDDYPPYQNIPLVQYRDPTTSTRQDPHPGGWLLYYPAIGPTLGVWGPVEPLNAQNVESAKAEAREFLRRRYDQHPEARP